MNKELLVNQDPMFPTRGGQLLLDEHRDREYDSYTRADRAFARLRRSAYGAVLFDSSSNPV
jgi:hypothetical protein